MSSTFRSKTKEQFRQRHYIHHISTTIILTIFASILFIITLFMYLFLSGKSRSSITNDTVHADDEIILRNRNEYSIHHIYIDIGCFNGETIEHFLHFIPDSIFYDIITFEPDPDNYQLCKQRLREKKYMNINIIILQKVVWIRDEKIYFQTKQGRQSRINMNANVLNRNSKELDAIDFSSWLARLVKPYNTKVHIKISMPGAEVLLLEKMINDDTLRLADRYEIEWTDRENPRTRPTRLYTQLMLDTAGFDCLYYIRLDDVRKVFQLNETFKNVPIYNDWRLVSEYEVHAYYAQRPDVHRVPNLIN
ncbi:unnamed protein product [Rotaria sp. Silwood2]|nr:unnamed protein product [Rotaria sp. Silwood2]CAF4073787.1 unnamed protein product [Rotaria sp. Silwood2]CAF4194410.1 unnamed protein product [Rotaria sp. Silwood2]